MRKAVGHPLQRGVEQRRHLQDGDQVRVGPSDELLEPGGVRVSVPEVRRDGGDRRPSFVEVVSTDVQPKGGGTMNQRQPEKDCGGAKRAYHQ